jgi:hypothetical protein
VRYYIALIAVAYELVQIRKHLETANWYDKRVGNSYSSERVVMGFYMRNSLNISDWEKYKTKGKYSKLMIAFDLLLLIGLLFQIVFSAEVFLSAGPGVNAAVHGPAFLFSFFLALCWVFTRKRVF